MKREGLLILVLLLVLPLASAVQVDMNQQFSQGENLLAIFSGNFVDQITPSNVYFYRNQVAIPITYDVTKIGDDFYVYALLTEKSAGNYSIQIKNVRYYKATDIIDDDIVSNFTITGDTAAFSIDPGVIKTSDDFSVEIQNLEDNKITINIEDPEGISSRDSITLNTGEKKTVDFTLSDTAPQGLENIDFSYGNYSYSMPVYLETGNQQSQTETSGTFNIEFQPTNAQVSMATDSNAKRIIYLKNTGTENIEDVSFNISSTLEPYITISPDTISSLDPNDTKQIEIDITSPTQEAIIEGKIIAYTENISSQFTLILNLTQDYIPPETEQGNEPVILATCSDLGGQICASNLECSGETQRAKDGVCCIAPATCQEPKKSSTGKYIGWILLVLVFVIIIWFFKKKYKHVARRKPF